MASLTITSTRGDTRTVEGAAGLSVMEIIRKAGFDDLPDSSDERTATSRLSCQIPFGPALDGLRVTIAEEG